MHLFYDVMKIFYENVHNFKFKDDLTVLWIVLSFLQDYNG